MFRRVINAASSSVPPSPAPAATPAPEPEPAPVVEAVADDAEEIDVVPLDVLKLQAISAITTAQDGEAVRGALTTLIKTVQMVSVAQAAAQPDAAAAASTSRGAPAPAAAAAVDGESVALNAMRAALKLRGTHGIISIGKRFKSMDDDNDNKISYDEFKKAIREMKLDLSETDMTKLFRSFDRDANGFVSFDELLVGLRGELNERRKDMVARAFKVLDRNGDGEVTLADLEGRYDATRHPDVIAGTKTHRQVLMEFMEVFEAQGGGTSGDGVVSLEEFSAYYAMVSASVDDDDYFELMIRNVWHISGGEGWCANTTCKRLLVVHTDGTQTVEELTDDFDVDLTDLEAIKRKLNEQGITDIKSVSLYGSIDETSPPANPNGASTSATPTGRGRGKQPHSSNIVFG